MVSQVKVDLIEVGSFRQEEREPPRLRRHRCSSCDVGLWPARIPYSCEWGFHAR